MSSNIISLDDARAVKRGAPDWRTDIKTCVLYAELVKAQHDAVSAQIHLDARLRGLESWLDAEDLKQRVDENNREWNRYVGLVIHTAELPAADRKEAQLKRRLVGRGWLTHGQGLKMCERMRTGCEADDHLFPPSLRLARSAA